MKVVSEPVRVSSFRSKHLRRGLIGAALLLGMLDPLWACPEGQQEHARSGECEPIPGWVDPSSSQGAVTGLAGFTSEKIELDASELATNETASLEVITHRFDGLNCWFRLIRIDTGDGWQIPIAVGVLAVVEGRISLNGHWLTGGYANSDSLSAAQIVVDEQGGLVGSLEVFHNFGDAGGVPPEPAWVDLAKSEGNLDNESSSMEIGLPIDGWADGRLDLRSCGNEIEPAPAVPAALADAEKGEDWLWRDVRTVLPVNGTDRAIRFSLMVEFAGSAMVPTEVYFHFDHRVLPSIDIDRMRSCAPHWQVKEKKGRRRIYLGMPTYLYSAHCIFTELEPNDQAVVQAVIDHIDEIIYEGTRGDDDAAYWAGVAEMLVKYSDRIISP